MAMAPDATPDLIAPLIAFNQHRVASGFELSGKNRLGEFPVQPEFHPLVLDFFPISPQLHLPPSKLGRTRTFCLEDARPHVWIKRFLGLPVMLFFPVGPPGKVGQESISASEAVNRRWRRHLDTLLA